MSKLTMLDGVQTRAIEDDDDAMASMNGLLLGTLVLAFEFSIVSAIPVGGDLVAGSPSTGIATMLAWDTLGRAAMSIPATALNERSGIRAAAILAAGSPASVGLAV